MHESTSKKFATSLDLSHFKGFYSLSLCSRILLWLYILCIFPYRAHKHTSFTSEASTCSYSFRGQKEKDPWSPKSLFHTLVVWPIVVLWWRLHRTPPMGHGKMRIGKEPCGFNIMPFFGYTLKSYVFIGRTLVLLSWWNLLSKKDSMN